MKSFGLISLLFILGFGNSPDLFGQPNIGLFVGVNNSNLAGDGPDKSKYQTNAGLIIGVNADFKLTDEVLLSFQPGLARGGAKLLYKDSVDNVYKDSISIDIDFFSLPVLFNIISNNKRFYFSSGLEFGYQLGSEASSSSDKIDISDDINRFNLAASFGLTYIIPVGKPFVFIEAKYSQGLTNITNSQNEDSYAPRVKTSGIKLRVGIQIPLSKEVKE